MKASIIDKLEALSEKHKQIGVLLSDPQVINDQDKYRDLGREYAQLDKVAKCYHQYRDNVAAIDETKQILESPDAELKSLAQSELAELKERAEDLEKRLKYLLLPQDPHDECNLFLEIRAGTGGDEAAIFAGDLFRMYSRYAELKDWQVEVISANEGEHGGYKEIISRIKGERAYSQLKFESGAHRVQRIPETESQGRIHTSAATVAILPEAQAIDHIDIDTSELRIDTFRASGAGGQHVNKTDSAIRITHLPSGLVVECQDDRSQHRNKARALALLQARLLDLKRHEQNQEQADTRKSLVGSGDRSERIRTYNFPQGRVTDHRIHLTLYQLAKLLEGDMDMVIKPLVNELQAEQLAKLEEG